MPSAPFPICLKHAGRLFAHLNDVTGVNDRLIGHRTGHATCLVPTYWGRQNVVYYLRLAKEMKIGWTGNLQSRIYHYPPHVELLAIEPGTKRLEAERHAQFNHLRLGSREWFFYAPDLQAHVESVIAEHGPY